MDLAEHSGLTNRGDNKSNQMLVTHLCLHTLMQTRLSANQSMHTISVIL